MWKMIELPDNDKQTIKEILINILKENGVKLLKTKTFILMIEVEPEGDN